MLNFKNHIMEKFWTKSSYSARELNEMSVEFSFPGNPVNHSGIGVFLVSENPEGLLLIDIRTDPKPGVIVDYHCCQEDVNTIRLAGSLSDCVFLVGVF